jgi:hypothetical protein
LEDACADYPKVWLSIDFDPVGKLVSQAQMGMTFTLKVSIDLNFPTESTLVKLACLM